MESPLLTPPDYDPAPSRNAFLTVIGVFTFFGLCFLIVACYQSRRIVVRRRRRRRIKQWDSSRAPLLPTSRPRRIYNTFATSPLPSSDDEIVARVPRPPRRGHGKLRSSRKDGNANGAKNAKHKAMLRKAQAARGKEQSVRGGFVAGSKGLAVVLEEAGTTPER